MNSELQPAGNNFQGAKKKLESRKWRGQGFLELLNQLLGGDWNIDFIYFSIQLVMEHHPN
jgi:hypothetical protein